MIIKEIIINKSIKLLLKIYINNIEKDIEISLAYNKNNNNIINNYMNVNNEIKILRGEIKLLKEEIEILKNNNLTENKLNKIYDCIKRIDNKDNININPKNIEYLCDIVNDSYSKYYFPNTFSVFKSINDILYLVYSNENK